MGELSENDREVSMTTDQMLIAAAISSWQQVIMRVGALCLSLNEEQLLVEVAPGKNRILYLWGHLTAVHDAMFSVLRTGERLHPLPRAEPSAERGVVEDSPLFLPHPRTSS